MVAKRKNAGVEINEVHVTLGTVKKTGRRKVRKPVP